MSNALDDNLYKIFAVEAFENLDSFEDALMKLESEGLQAAVVQEAFRMIHNIKGSAAMVGLTGVSELAHAMEDKLDQIRKGQLGLDSDLANVLFNGIARLRDLIKTPELTDDPEINAQSKALIAILRGEAPAKPQPQTAVAPEQPVSKPAIIDDGFSWDRRDIIHIVVEINNDVVFKDVKAYLVKTNLLEIGTVARISPPLDMEDSSDAAVFNFLVLSTADPDTIREKVERATEIKRVAIVPVTSSELNAVKSIYDKESDGQESGSGVSALRKWGDSTFSVIVHRVSEMTNVIKFIGEMDGDGVVTLMDLFQESPSLLGNIILDFSKLNYINSLGLGFLIRLYKNVQEKEGRIQILAPTSNIKKLLDNTKISSLIPVIATVNESVTSRIRG